MSIKHIEFWVSNLEKSLAFYKKLFAILEWTQVDKNGFKSDGTKIYFIEQPVTAIKTVGPRHICFRATSREIVNQVGQLLQESELPIIRGPLEYTYESRHAYTVDFKDPDGYILEVATESVEEN